MLPDLQIAGMLLLSQVDVDAVVCRVGAGAQHQGPGLQSDAGRHLLQQVLDRAGQGCVDTEAFQHVVALKMRKVGGH